MKTAIATEPTAASFDSMSVNAVNVVNNVSKGYRAAPINIARTKKYGSSVRPSGRPRIHDIHDIHGLYIVGPSIHGANSSSP